MYSRRPAELSSTVAGALFTIATLSSGMKELLISVAFGAGSLSPA